MEFEEIYTTYWDKIFRVCMGYVNDHSQAQDLAQETFITVWKKLPGFRNEAGIGTWIYRIATNHCLRQIEKGKRAKSADMPADLPEEKSPNLEPDFQLLYKLISELPEIDRIIISLELEDVKQAEIARITGLSEINIRVKIHRIKERLTKKFAEHGK